MDFMFSAIRMKWMVLIFIASPMHQKVLLDTNVWLSSSSQLLTFVLPLFNLSLISPFLLKTKLKGLYIDEENLLSDIGQF